MARIFITGSSDGIGSLTAQALIKRGHEVYLHARNAQRAQDANKACPGAKDCLVADLSSTSETKSLAKELNSIGSFDSIIHNAGLMSGGSGSGKDGIPSLFAVNTLAPYMLTCLVDPPPKRYVFVSSGLHSSGSAELEGERLKGCGYGDSKLHDIMLAFAFAKRFGGKVASNAIDPGWVPTKMGGYSAPGNIQGSVDGYVMLALGEGEAKGKTGTYWSQTSQRSPESSANDEKLQQKLLGQLEEISGVNPPD